MAVLTWLSNTSSSKNSRIAKLQSQSNKKNYKGNLIKQYKSSISTKDRSHDDKIANKEKKTSDNEEFCVSDVYSMTKKFDESTSFRRNSISRHSLSPSPRSSAQSSSASSRRPSLYPPSSDADLKHEESDKQNVKKHVQKDLDMIAKQFDVPSSNLLSTFRKCISCNDMYEADIENQEVSFRAKSVSFDSIALYHQHKVDIVKKDEQISAEFGSPEKISPKMLRRISKVISLLPISQAALLESKLSNRYCFIRDNFISMEELAGANIHRQNTKELLADSLDCY